MSLQRIFLRLAPGVALLALLMAPVGGLAHDHEEWSDPECWICHAARPADHAPPPPAAPPPAPPQSLGFAETAAVAKGETCSDPGSPRAPPV